MMISKLKAAAVHLAVCIFVSLAVAGIVFFGWYEGVLSDTQNVGRILLLIIAVDIVLGPLLTFIVYKKNKKSLRFDLSVIAGAQLLALAYGVSAVYEARPAFIVFAMDRFEAVATVDWPKGASTLASPSAVVRWMRPSWVATTFPNDPEERSEIILSSAGGGPDISHIPKLYVPLASQVSEVIKKSQDIGLLKTFNPLQTSQIDQIILRARKSGIEISFLPLKGGQTDASVIIDKKTGEVVEVALLKPWP
jgi:hypothetical protein